VLPCAQYCADYWNACSTTLYTDWSQVIQSNYATSTIPNCYNGTYNASWTTGSLVAQPQPPDVWGGRAIPSWLVTVEGLEGEALFPLDQYAYTFSNGSSVTEQCYSPNETTEFGTLPATQCTLPLEISANGQTCELPCPFPLYSADVQHSIEWAFIAPAIIGLVLCVFTLVDSSFVICMANNQRVKRAFGNMFQSSKAPGSSTSAYSGNKTSKLQLRASTLYALLGSLLGVLYFFIGALPSLLYWENISCSTPMINIQDIAGGNLPASPSACAAQRVAPFVLQAIFNLVLYAMIKVYWVLNRRMQNLTARQKQLMEGVIVAYCVGLPCITLIIAFSLDHVSTNVFEASVQLARQSTVCQFRLQTAAEWLLMFVPFITTGVGVTYVSVRIVEKIVAAKKQLGDGTASILSANTASDKALVLLMFRLMALGLSTFFVLIIVIATTTIMTSEITAYSAAYTTYFTCVSQPLSCVDCSLWGDLSTARRPQAVVATVQLAAMSCILLLFGFFFGLHSATQLYHDWMDGRLRHQIYYVLHCGRRSTSTTTGTTSHRTPTASGKSHQIALSATSHD